MLTIPTALWPYLLSEGYRYAEVYEIAPIDTLLAAERAPNIGFESWASSTDANSWSEYPNSGAVTKDTTQMRSGTACVRMTAGAGGQAIETYSCKLPTPGSWARFEVYVKASVAKAQGVAIRIVNLTTVRELKADLTWSAGNTGIKLFFDAGTSYQRIAFWFPVEAAAGAGDNYAISLQMPTGVAWTTGDFLYFDDVSLFGCYERPCLYYSSQSVAWNGNSYVGLATRRGKLTEEMKLSIPDVELAISNTTNALRPYLAPVDTLTGARLTVRLLVKDATDTPLTDSFIRFIGRIEPPKMVDDKEFPLVAVALLDGVGVEAPSRRMSLVCRWQFANSGRFDGAGDCTYQSSTTASGAGAASTALVLARQPATTASGAGVGSVTLVLAAASTFANGDIIRVGGQSNRIVSGAGTTTLILTFPMNWSSGTAVTWAGNFKDGDIIQIGGGPEVAIASGGGTTSVTLAAARTWSSGNEVRFSTCPNRSRQECESRGMLHRFGGHPGVSGTARLARKYDRSRRDDLVQIRGTRRAPAPSTSGYGREIAGAAYTRPSDALVVVFGRRRVSPPVIELVTSQAPNDGHAERTSFHSIGVGAIDSVVAWYIDNVVAGHVSATGTLDLKRAIYYRVGGDGVNDVETVAEYVADVATQLRAQNIDYRSFAAISYHREAYAIFVQFVDYLVDETLLSADVKGVKLQKYDAAGAASGSRVWSPSPIWQMVEWAMADYALGLAAADVDNATNYTEATYGEELIYSSDANTRPTTGTHGVPSTSLKVDSTEGFILGRQVDVNGVANTVAAIVDDRELTLGTAANWGIGDIVVQRPQRFESHLVIAQGQRATDHLKSFLDSCRGFITYDQGRVQFRIERGHVATINANGDFEAWASATDANNWTELVPTGVTVNRDSSVKHSGTYSARIDRSDAGPFGGLQYFKTGFEPGRWYRVTFWHRQSANGAGMTVACRLRIRNVRTNESVEADGISWNVSPATVPLTIEGSTSFVKYEVTFKFREDFLVADSVEFGFVPYFLAGQSVWYDDVIIRGPYAGDFREFTKDSVMGWKEDSFRWSLDRKDRETNRVVVRFMNESAQFGDDEVEANDFVHQQSHVIKTKTYDIPNIADRDQAQRMAQFYLDKLRTVGPGCEFLGSPAALALQPGDVILVSDTVPGWTCEEQRVTEVSILGAPDRDEHFVQVKTEAYSEAIYSDVGRNRGGLPQRASQLITVTVAGHTGGRLDLTWTTAIGAVVVREFRIYSSADSGFQINANTLIGRTHEPRYSYFARLDEIEEVRYYRVTAVTDYNETPSVEFTATIFAVDFDATDGTQGENNADGNMIYDSGFQGTEYTDGTTVDGDGWLCNTPPATYTDVNPSGNTTPGPNGDTAFSLPANAYDNNATTYATGTSTFTLSGGVEHRAVLRLAWAAATRTGRVKLTGKVVGFAGQGTVGLWYSLNGGSSWTQFAAPVSTIDTAYYSPRLVATVMANFLVEVRPLANTGGFTNTSKVFAVAEVDFQEEAANQIISHLVDGRAELRGVFGTGYAQVRRRFPGRTPPANGTYLVSTSPNRWEFKAQKLTPGSATAEALQLILYDKAAGRVWVVASISSATIVDGWRVFTGMFDPGASTPVAGQVEVYFQTDDPYGYRVTQVYIGRSLGISGYQVSAEDQSIGRFPDLRISPATNWPKGKLAIGATSYRYVDVAG